MTFRVSLHFPCRRSFLPWICSQSIQNQNTFSRNALHPEKYFCTILCNIISDSRLYHPPHRSNWEYRIMEGEQSLLLLPVQRTPVHTNHSSLCTMHSLQSKCTCELFAHPLVLNIWLLHCALHRKVWFFMHWWKVRTMKMYNLAFDNIAFPLIIFPFLHDNLSPSLPGGILVIGIVAFVVSKKGYTRAATSGA